MTMKMQNKWNIYLRDLDLCNIHVTFSILFFFLYYFKNIVPLYIYVSIYENMNNAALQDIYNIVNYICLLEKLFFLNDFF